MTVNYKYHQNQPTEIRYTRDNTDGSPDNNSQDIREVELQQTNAESFGNNEGDGNGNGS